MIGTNAMQSTDGLLHLHQLKNSPSSSSRILDIPCKVCGDFSSGKHYNIFACDGCAGFFKRSIRRNRQYVCKAKPEGGCLVDKTHRNQCRACRLTKCQEAGMNKDAVQHERGPRNSTLRRQHMTQYLAATDPRFILPTPSTHALDLALPKHTQSHLEHPIPLLATSAPPFLCNPAALAAFAYHQSHHLNPPMVPAIPGQFMQLYNNPATICESAAQLLFMNVKWAKSVPSFTSLIMSDQFILLEESWRELFILGASQFRVPLELTSLVQACGVMQREPERIIPFLQDVKDFQDLLGKIGQFSLDPHEYACLRAIVLFKTSFDRNCNSPVSSTSGGGESTSKILTDPVTVASIQDNTQLVLNKYMTTAQPCQPLRFGKLLMLLPQLRTINGDTIEELFFRSTIGTIPIVKIICDMYKTTTNGN